jgi:hypothetical protein
MAPSRKSKTPLVASAAIVQNHAGIRSHLLGRLMPAMWTGQS